VLSAKARLVMDGLMLAAFVAAFNPAVTGLPLHEWLSVALIFAGLFHLIVNWEWVLRVGRRLFARLRAKSKLDFCLDVSLFVATVTVMLSGVMLSQVVAPFFGMTATPTLLWHYVHAVSAIVTIALIALHAILHWEWIVRVAEGGRRPSTPAEPAFSTLSAERSSAR
jgi:hypothetical protein